jgi:hypothetical protein
MPCSHELIERKWGLSDWSASVSLASFSISSAVLCEVLCSSAVLPTCAALTAEEQTEDFTEDAENGRRAGVSWMPTSSG